MLAEAPDVVIIATGGLPHTDWVDGNATLLSSWDVLSGMASLEGDVLVHDQTGRNVAMAAADYLSEHGANVTLTTQDAKIGMEAMRLEMSPFMKRFYERGVVMQVDSELIKAETADNKISATFRNMHTGKLSHQSFDHIVVEAGTLPMTSCSTNWIRQRRTKVSWTLTPCATGVPNQSRTLTAFIYTELVMLSAAATYIVRFSTPYGYAHISRCYHVQILSAASYSNHPNSVAGFLLDDQVERNMAEGPLSQR